VTPAVSVCIPAFQAEAYIGATIRSVREQTLTDWELVIVDDCSTDRTLAEAHAASAGDPRIRITRNESNLGPAANWNRAVAATAAPYVKLLCSDDTLAPACLERQVTALRSDSAGRVALVAARRDIIDANGAVLIHNRGLGQMAGRVQGRVAIRECIRAGTNLLGEPSFVLLRRETLDRVGGFDERWRYTIDLECYWRMLRGHDLIAVAETLGAFRVSREALSARLAGQQRAEARELLRHVRAADNSAVSALDVAVGSVRSALLQQGRRVLVKARGRRTRGPAARTLSPVDLQGP
jgi:glycosyltransferase involved in cell wall biosynthesis